MKTISVLLVFNIFGLVVLRLFRITTYIPLLDRSVAALMASFGLAG